MSEQIEQPLSSDLPEAVSMASPGVGAVLRAAREAAGLQVAEVAQTLKLGPRQVEALEAEDWPGLPGPTFTRGFVRNYARMVGVDPAPLMDALDRLLDKPVDTLDVPAATPTEMPVSSRRRDRLVVAFGVGLVVLAAAAYLLLPGDLTALRDNAQSLLDGMARKDVPVAVQPAAPVDPAFPPGTTGQQLIAPQAAMPADAVPAAEPAAQAAAPAAVAVAPVAPTVDDVVPPQLRFVLTQASWLEVRDRDGTIVFSQRLPAGSEQVVAGKGPLTVAVGYAPGVKLFSRGQVVDLVPHTKGDVARLVLE